MSEQTRTVNDCFMAMARGADDLWPLLDGLSRRESEDLCSRLASLGREIKKMRESLQPAVSGQICGPHARQATRLLRQLVLVRDKGNCRYCGQYAGAEPHLDHVVPWSVGGLTREANLVTACERCNSRKNDRTPEEAGMTLLPIPE